MPGASGFSVAFHTAIHHKVVIECHRLIEVFADKFSYLFKSLHQMPGNLLTLPETQACELHETGGKLVGLRNLRHDLRTVYNVYI